MAGKFVLSLDCEGKWGMADHLTKEHHKRLSNANLMEAYKWIVNTCDKHKIPATFAFVLAMLLNKKQQNQFRDYLNPSTAYAMQWMSAYQTTTAENHFEGWHLPQLLDYVVNAKTNHEIASHGFSHLPFDQERISDEEAHTEFNALSDASKELSIDLKTMVYPRNIVGFQNELVRQDIIGYRTNLNTSKIKAASKIQAFSREFNVFEKAQANGKKIELLFEIPPGYILNFPLGARKLVSSSITIKRWESILDDAAENNKTALLWLHPHNLIQAPETRDSLNQILAHAAHLREHGKLHCVTQADYCI